MKKILAFLLMSSPALAQDGIPRGLGHPSMEEGHWYDTSCCDRRDCEPVEPGAIRQTSEGYQVMYLTSRGFIASGVVREGTGQVRPSRDHREHACATSQRVLCIYLPFGS